MKELAEKAAAAPATQYLQEAENILKDTETATNMVAFLLQNYFEVKASQAEQSSKQRSRQLGAGTEEGNEDFDGTDSDRSGKRRRRRRGRAGTGRGNTQPTRGELPFEIVDAKDILRGLTSSRPSENEPSAQRTEANTQQVEPAAKKDGLTRIRVNIGFDDGFKGRGTVAKKISALAGLNEGILVEEESRRGHAVLKATAEIAEMVLDRVDGARLGKKVLVVELSS